MKKITKLSKLFILIPVYNDWNSVKLLIEKIDNVLVTSDQIASIFIVDDHSSDLLSNNLIDYNLSQISMIHVLTLKRNLGHQRAIAIGLTHLYAEYELDAVVIMDGDGEDIPDDIPRLIEKSKNEGNEKIVFAERYKRSESIVFKFFYMLYRVMHKILTGITVKVGNFSIIPTLHLATLTVSSEMWNHYTASVFLAKIPYSTILTTRGNRLAGKSQMNFVNLILHGFSAISVFSSTVGVRLLIASFSLVMILIFLLGIFIYLYIYTKLYIYGWVIYVSGIFLIGIFQTLIFVSAFILFNLRSRNSFDFIPIRDYKYFINDPVIIYPKNE